VAYCSSDEERILRRSNDDDGASRAVTMSLFDVVSLYLAWRPNAFFQLYALAFVWR
jgi:hypothetical protein